MNKFDEEGTIDLRGSSKEEEAEFRIDHVEADKASSDEVEAVSDALNTKVKVKFDKFVNLVASHAYEEIFEKYSEEDVIIGTNLLTDLANAHEEKSDKKLPLMFVGGIILGGILMWFLLRN